MIKRFFASGLSSLLILSALWMFGFDNIFVDDEDTHEKNLQKYVQTQRRVIDNYVDKVDVDMLFKDSMRGFVKALDDSTLSLSGTPLDTTFAETSVSNFRESAIRFERAYSYVESEIPDADLNMLTEEALAGMFSSLDPYTTYIDPDQSDRVRESFDGKFQGIGVQFEIIADSITVISAISGGPSDQLGIRSGDRIISIDDENAVGFSQEDVLNTLRGPKNSKVDIGVKRPGESQVMDFTITRDDIPLYTIDTSYMLDERTGYIKVNRFASTTYEEFMESMEELKEMGMERLVLDVRFNPGGFLDQAVRMTGEFFPEGTPLVSTKSRHSRFTSEYNTRSDGSYQDLPLIVLINEGSASGSEILAGAIQDNDRGLIAGRRTFGKGLVQQQYELVDESFIRVTISRYYTPAGRLIQKPFRGGKEEYALEIMNRPDNATTDVRDFISNLPDSLEHETRAGRTVYGGGGIVPDHILQADTTRSEVLGFMRRNNIGFEFVRDFLDNNSEDFRDRWEDDFEGFREEFSWDERYMDDFWNRMEDAGMVYSDTTETATYEDEKLYINPELVERDRDIPAGFTKAELARQIWGTEKYYPVYNDIFDNTLKEAVRLWDEVRQLQAYTNENRDSKATGTGG